MCVFNVVSGVHACVDLCVSSKYKGGLVVQ